MGGKWAFGELKSKKEEWNWGEIKKENEKEWNYEEDSIEEGRHCEYKDIKSLWYKTDSRIRMWSRPRKWKGKKKGEVKGFWKKKPCEVVFYLQANMRRAGIFDSWKNPIGPWMAPLAAWRNPVRAEPIKFDWDYDDLLDGQVSDWERPLESWGKRLASAFQTNFVFLNLNISTIQMDFFHRDWGRCWSERASGEPSTICKTVDADSETCGN